MSNDTTPPLEVSTDQIQGQVTTAARYIVTTLGGYALGKGWIDNDLLQVLVGIVTILAPAAYGVYRTFTQKSQLITVAKAAPNSVATVVEK
jgi:hypothetical protein